MTITSDTLAERIALALIPECQNLNEKQKEVVAYDSGQLLVLAGPGSGKTESLTLCAMNLLLLNKALPSQIILCTYTKKAAYEMHDRIYAIASKVGLVIKLRNCELTLFMVFVSVSSLRTCIVSLPSVFRESH